MLAQLPFAGAMRWHELFCCRLHGPQEVTSETLLSTVEKNRKR